MASRTNKGIKDAYVMCYPSKQTFKWTNNFHRQGIKEEDIGHQKKNKSETGQLNIIIFLDAHTYITCAI